MKIEKALHKSPKLLKIRMQSGGYVYFNDTLVHSFGKAYNGISFSYFIGDVN